MKEVVVKILESLRPGEDYVKSENFVVDGLLDSFDLIVLVSELDEHFTISIKGTDIIPENFMNIEAINTLLTKYTS
ncbi:acyl carrier protein [Labilibaculum antarcticum]|uniref:Acyl carrier protein n=1 Tax=Labilibaculum antarcticum TaxID=1717717 RepID=A0A1Y1CQG7_9BACT|nr:acyl carrier protein [Labilibaculum antarcticum]BAX82625.1 acyl carrier protein [Labilibaculum antarcticum]